MPIKGVKLGADLDLEVGRSSGLRSTLKSHLATSRADYGERRREQS